MVVKGRGGSILSDRPSDCVIFFSYIGSRVTSNMVIMEVSLLSGFVLAPGSRMLVRSLESEKGWLW